MTVPDTTHLHLQRWALRRMGAIERRPQGWGDPDAIVAQYELLLELLHFDPEATPDRRSGGRLLR